MNALMSATFLAAVVAALLNLLFFWRRAIAARRTRARQIFAEAFRTYTAYKEFPYVVRRRNGKSAASERIRISENLRSIQADIALYEIWTFLESDSVGIAYQKLVLAMRDLAGTAIKAAWKARPIRNDAGMVIPRSIIDLSSLQTLEEAYMDAVRSDLERQAF